MSSPGRAASGRRASARWSSGARSPAGAGANRPIRLRSAAGGIAGEVGDGGEQPGVSGHPAHAPRPRVMDDARNGWPPRPLSARCARAWCVRIEAGVGHPQRTEHLPATNRSSGSPVTRRTTSPSRIGPVSLYTTRSPAGDQGFRAAQPDRFVVPGPVRFQTDVRSQARRVGEQVADGDAFLAPPVNSRRYWLTACPGRPFPARPAAGWPARRPRPW